MWRLQYFLHLLGDVATTTGLKARYAFRAQLADQTLDFFRFCALFSQESRINEDGMIAVQFPKAAA
jgi:hypothetical protein